MVASLAKRKLTIRSMFTHDSHFQCTDLSSHSVPSCVNTQKIAKMGSAVAADLVVHWMYLSPILIQHGSRTVAKQSE